MTVGPTPSPTVRHLLRDDLRGMYPGYFALVMATGILSNAFFYLGHDALSDALYGVALVAFPALVWALNGETVRVASYDEGFASDQYLGVAVATDADPDSTGRFPRFALKEI